MNNETISPVELKKLLAEWKNEILIADIREPGEYEDWHINGSINVPLNSLLVNGDYPGMKKALSLLPKDKLIVAVCLRGINSQVVASFLSEMGYKSASLEKGMKGWNENFDIYEIDFPDFVVVQFVRIGKGCLSYVIYSKRNRVAAIVEPSIFVDNYLNYISTNNLNLKYILDTHSHADHFSGAMELANDTGVDYWISSVDTDSDFKYRDLLNMKEIILDDLKIEILQTPGHTDGSLSFLINNKALLCGDLLLLESPGRPDLARTVEETVKGAGILFDTLQNIIFKLDSSVKILPSHYTKTELRPVVLSLEELRNQSEPLRIRSRSDFVDFLTSNIPLTPPNFDSIKKFNKAGAIIPIEYAEDLEIGPNRCAAR